MINNRETECLSKVDTGDEPPTDYILAKTCGPLFQSQSLFLYGMLSFILRLLPLRRVRVSPVSVEDSEIVFTAAAHIETRATFTPTPVCLSTTVPSFRGPG